MTSTDSFDVSQSHYLPVATDSKSVALGS